MIPTRCPKCGHGPLPAGLAADAACPACGVILAKARARSLPAAEVAEVPAAIPAQHLKGVSDVLWHVPDQVDRAFWTGRLITLVLFVVWTVFILRAADVPEGEAGSHFLWAVLTPFHEAGHYLIFRWFGAFIMTLGGTLGQMLMPIVLAVALLRRGDPFGAALFCWLLGFSLIMTGVYMYDAFDPRLMLLDGRTGADSDGHDWQNIFGDLGLLKRARGIGRFTGALGRIVMLGSLAWAALIVWLQRARLSDNPFAEGGPDA